MKSHIREVWELGRRKSRNEGQWVMGTQATLVLSTNSDLRLQSDMKEWKGGLQQQGLELCRSWDAKGDTRSLVLNNFQFLHVCRGQRRVP